MQTYQLDDYTNPTAQALHLEDSWRQPQKAGANTYHTGPSAVWCAGNGAVLQFAGVDFDPSYSAN